MAAESLRPMTDQCPVIVMKTFNFTCRAVNPSFIASYIAGNCILGILALVCFPRLELDVTFYFTEAHRRHSAGTKLASFALDARAKMYSFQEVGPRDHGPVLSQNDARLLDGVIGRPAFRLFPTLFLC